MAAEAARRCIAALDAKKQDISMLFLLSRMAWLERFATGKALIDWLRNDMKIRTGEVAPPEFQAEVRRVFESRGIVPVAPERCVHATTKQEVRDRCLQAGWPTPFFPVMLQTRPKGAVGFGRKEVRKREESGVFILFSCWPDALHALIAMAGTNTYKGYAADFVFENQVVDFGPKQLKFPCRIILDCDAKVAEFNNEYDIEELQQSIDRVAPWFVKQLVTIKAIKPTDEVVCYQKNKSRPGKASAHLIFGIMGISTDDIREVLDRIFVAPWRKEQERQRLEAEKEAKSGEDPPKKKKQRLTPQKKLPEPWQVADRSTMHGRNQFSTLFFKNPDKNEQEFPCIGHKLVIVNGEVKQRLRLSFSRAEFSPENPQALSLLRCCCYTSFMPEFVTLSADFMMERGAKKGGPSRPRAGPSTSSPAAKSSGFLPAWMESAVQRVTGRRGYALNTSMPCLDKVHAQLVQFVPEAKRESTAHINGALFCPNYQDEPRIHSSNGIFVVVVGDDVYATCSDKSCYNKHQTPTTSGDSVEVVAGTEKGYRPWVKYTEESYSGLEKRMMSSHVGARKQE